VELGALLTPLAERMTAGSRQGLLLLLAAVGRLLLICLREYHESPTGAQHGAAGTGYPGGNRRVPRRLGQQMLTESLILSHWAAWRECCLRKP